MVLGVEDRVEHLPQQWPGLLQLVLLVLDRNPGGPVVLEDLPPGVEQVHDPILNAAQTVLSLVLVCERLLAHAFKEGIEQAALERHPDIRDLLGPLRGS